VNADPGGLTVRIDDHRMEVAMTGGGEFTVPVGPALLVDTALQGADPPAPHMLTNALGLVQDHLDDLIIEAPSIAAAPSVVATGPHAVAMARVEIGADTVPDDYVLHRADADEVFRTLAVEPVADRRHNPGLDDTHVESIIGTCCVILGIMRRLELSSIAVRPDDRPTG
jgi:exopolyphosphatase / guanosine-5'-triphosphate,3'-diphosphate pyrophosphatase